LRGVTFGGEQASRCPLHSYSPRFKALGLQRGISFLGDQKVSIAVFRVRDILEGKEVPLSSYRGFQNTRSIYEVVFKSLINEISTRKYEKAALEVPATFGINNALSEKAVIQCCQ